MKSYSRQFEMQDIRAKSKASKDVLDNRKRLMDEFNAYRTKVVDIWQSQKPRRLELRMRTFSNSYLCLYFTCP